MVHAALMGAVLTRAVFMATGFGAVVQKVNHAAAGVRLFVLNEKLRRLKHEMELGLNRSEEAHHLTTHGTFETLFPARIRIEDLPARFETVFKVKVAGQYLFKISEWNEVWDWILQKTLRQNGQEARPEGRDGRWLLHAAGQRWKDPDLRVKAFRNSVRFADLWRKTEMWDQQDS